MMRWEDIYRINKSMYCDRVNKTEIALGLKKNIFVEINFLISIMIYKLIFSILQKKYNLATSVFLLKRSIFP